MPSTLRTRCDSFAADDAPPTTTNTSDDDDSHRGTADV
jgi:hypothetical protein